MNIVINGMNKIVEGNKTILEICQESGIYVPTLCYDDRL